MNLRWMGAAVVALALCGTAMAQDAGGPPAGQNQDGTQRGGGRGQGRGMGFGAGAGVMGTVTEIANDHFTVKTQDGETWTVHYSPNTRIMKQAPRPAGSGEQAGSGNSAAGDDAGGARRGMGMRNPPQPIKPADVKVGDAIMAGGETDQSAKSIGAIGIMVLDPDSAKRMERMQADYGKTWLMGQLTTIDGTTLTLAGGPDNQSHTFTVDENTTFRRRREPITLADLKPGDRVRVQGSVKDGQFVATSVAQMAMPQARGGPMRPPGPPPE
jgi:hypothetical protein